MSTIRNKYAEDDMTFRVDGPTSKFQGLGDIHEDEFSDLKTNATFAGVFQRGECPNELYVYPMKAFKDTFF